MRWVTVFGREHHLGIYNQTPGPTQPPTLCGAGNKIPAKSAVMLCGRRVKAGWLIPFVDKRVGGR